MFVAAAGPSPIVDEPARRAAVRALIVDPHDDTRELYREALEGDGLMVTHAATLGEGLHIVVTEHPAVVSTELRFEDGDGLEFCRHLRASADTSHIPIVIVTAETRPARLADAREIANAVFIKPCPPEAYATVMRKIAAGGRMGALRAAHPRSIR